MRILNILLAMLTMSLVCVCVPMSGLENHAVSMLQIQSVSISMYFPQPSFHSNLAGFPV